MEGLYFHSDGKETQYFKNFKECAEIKVNEALWKFQPCNKRWTKTEGSTVSCPKGSNTIPMNLVPTGADVVDGLICVCVEKNEITGELLDHCYKLIGVDQCYPYVNKKGQIIRQNSCADEANSSLRNGDLHDIPGSDDQSISN